MASLDPGLPGHGARSERPTYETLSDRDFEMLRLIVTGKTLGESAELLSLSPKPSALTGRACLINGDEDQRGADSLEPVAGLEK